MTRNAPKGIPKDTEFSDNLQNENLEWGRLGATGPHLDNPRGVLEGGHPSKFCTGIRKQNRSASDSVLPTNTGTSKKNHTLYLNLPRARWRFGAVRVYMHISFAHKPPTAAQWLHTAPAAQDPRGLPHKAQRRGSEQLCTRTWSTWKHSSMQHNTSV